MQVARVAIEDDQWRAFRALALSQHLSVSGYLGRLVAAELTRRRAWPVEVAQGRETSDVEQALGGLAEVRAAIDELDDIAARLARSAIALGASWPEVASPLRLRTDAAKAAYERALRDSP
jgi:hypothetical protein